MLPWASVMLAFNARPPDPAIVGDELAVDVARAPRGQRRPIELWLRHQRRDDYWQHGSVGERYEDIEVRCSRWPAGPTRTSNAVLRLLASLDVPRKGLVGPWGHMWPEIGRPGPGYGFLQEVRPLVGPLAQGPRHRRSWTSRCSGRGCRSPSPPAPDYDERPGRWVARPRGPAADEPPLAFVLDAEGLAAEPTGDARSSTRARRPSGSTRAHGAPTATPPTSRSTSAATTRAR